jgi:hypothetical protein
VAGSDSASSRAGMTTENNFSGGADGLGVDEFINCQEPEISSKWEYAAQAAISSSTRRKKYGRR